MILDALRLAIGLPTVLLLPGWMWSLAVLPRSRAAPIGARVVDVDLVERLVLAFALSVATVPLVALAWSAGLHLPLGLWGSLAVVALTTLSGTLVWRLRARRAA